MTSYTPKHKAGRRSLPPLATRALVAGAIAGCLAFTGTTAAVAATWNGDLANQNTYSVSISDNSIAELEALGLSNIRVETEGTIIRVLADGSASDAFLAEHGLTRLDTDSSGVTLLAQYTNTYDDEAVSPLFAKGDATMLHILHSQMSAGSVTNLSANTSFYEGGTQEGEQVTAVTDWEGDPELMKPHRSDAGLLPHNEDTFSTATDGDTGFYVQAFAYGNAASDGVYGGVTGTVAVAISDPIYVEIDTTSVDWNAAGQSTFSSVVHDEWTPGGEFSIENGVPVYRVKAGYQPDGNWFGNNITIREVGNLPRADVQWFAPTVPERYHTSLAIEVAEGANGRGTVLASGMAGVESISAGGLTPGETTINIETSALDPVFMVDGEPLKVGHVFEWGDGHSAELIALDVNGNTVRMTFASANALSSGVGSDFGGQVGANVLPPASYSSSVSALYEDVEPPVEPEQPEQPPVEPEQPPVEPEQPPVEPEQPVEPPVEPQPQPQPVEPPVAPEQPVEPPVAPEQPQPQPQPVQERPHFFSDTGLEDSEPTVLATGRVITSTSPSEVGLLVGLGVFGAVATALGFAGRRKSQHIA